MRILYISQYFPPESGATQTRAFEMTRNFVRLGHAVTVISEFPNHPIGIIPEAYRGRWWERDEMEGIDIIRVWVKTSRTKNLRTRLFFYLTFMVNAFLAGLFLTHGRYDLIYASSPPLFVGGAAVWLSKIKRTHLVFEVRDLWPESAVALGELQDQKSIILATKLEKLCYRSASRIIVVTQGIYDRLINRGIPADKLVLIPNGANTELFTFNPEHRNASREYLNLQDKFTVIYTGIFGIAQGLESVVEAAQLLKDNTQIQFLLIGDGPRREKIESLVNHYQLQNMTLLPHLPREEIPQYLSAADIALVPLVDQEIFKGALPSKMFDAWACSRPILLSVDGEARQLMEQIHGGIFIQPGSATAIAEILPELMKKPDFLTQMGNNGRAFTALHYSRSQLAERLLSHLIELTQED